MPSIPADSGRSRLSLSLKPSAYRAKRQRPGNFSTSHGLLLPPACFDEVPTTAVGVGATKTTMKAVTGSTENASQKPIYGCGKNTTPCVKAGHEQAGKWRFVPWCQLACHGTHVALPALCAGVCRGCLEKEECTLPFIKDGARARSAVLVRCVAAVVAAAAAATAVPSGHGAACSVSVVNFHTSHTPERAIAH